MKSGRQDRDATHTAGSAPATRSPARGARHVAPGTWHLARGGGGIPPSAEPRARPSALSLPPASLIGNCWEPCSNLIGTI